MWTFYGEGSAFVMFKVVEHQESPPPPPLPLPPSATEQSSPFPKPFGIKDGHSVLKEWCSG